MPIHNYEKEMELLDKIKLREEKRRKMLKEIENSVALNR